MAPPPSERRKGPDLWLKVLTVSGLISGISLVFALFVTAMAKPEVETFFDRYYNVRMRKSWDMELIELISYLLLLCLFSSFLGLGINARRRRRKDDYIRASLIFTLGVALFGLAGCLMLIGRYS
jgi:uncharacterized membrane protein